MFYDSITKQYNKEIIFPDYNIWYNDNLYIEEIKTVETHRDTTGTITRITPIAYYLFMDRNSKSFYHYSTFNDTARIIDKYKLPDTAVMKGVGGWPFYRNMELELVSPINPLADTVINKVIYGRAQFQIKTNGFLVTAVSYQRCDRKGSVFQFDKNLGKKLGCPITRIDFLPSLENPMPISSTIDFIKDNLTNDERKIFNSWEKNIKKYPAYK